MTDPLEDMAEFDGQHMLVEDMTTAPERIGLITNGFDQWALATTDEADIAVHYVRKDLYDAAQDLINYLKEKLNG